MSTLVMTERDGVACIAADTLTSYGSTIQSAKYTENHEKILRVGDAYVGVVGWSASLCVLDSVFAGPLPLPEIRTERELFEFSLKLHAKLKDDYFLNESDGASAWESSQMTLFLLNEHGLFGLYSNRTVERYRRFAAVGSGSDFALGAMYAAYERGAACDEVARLGVEAGAEFDESSATPITLKRVKLAAQAE